MSQTKQAKMTLNNLEPLSSGQCQSLSLRIHTQGYKRLYIVIPVGTKAGDLMDETTFREMLKPSIHHTDVKIGIEKQKDISNGRAILLIDSIPDIAPQTFHVVLGDFEVNKEPGMVTLRLRDEGERLATVEVTKTLPPPKIKRFTASHYNVIDQDEITLSWTIEPPGKYKLKLQERLLKEGKSSGTEQYKTMAEGGQPNVYKLQALKNDKITDTRVIVINSFTETSVKSYRGPGEGILGLYSRRGKLYAIVQRATDTQNAYLYATENGFTRTDWKQIEDGSGSPIRIPTAFAGSPGVIFQDKLWLMGGSSYDPNDANDQVGYYSFDLNTWFDDVGKVDGESARWPKGMGRRMGHAVLVSPDGKEIWVMGGYEQSGGSKDDIWAYNGAKWRELDHPPWERRCMFGAAATADSIWIGGGFETPGGKACDDVWRWDSQKGWKETGLWLGSGGPSPGADKKQCCACAFAFFDDLYYFITTYDPKIEEAKYESKIFLVTYGNNAWNKSEMTGVAADWAMNKDYYSLACVAFHGCIFTRRLARELVDENIHYFVRVP